PMAVKLDADKPAAEVLWRGKSSNPVKPDGPHVLMTPPVLRDGYAYNVSANGELSCISLKDNKALWTTFDATGGKAGDCATAFFTQQGDRYVIFNDQGELILAEMSPKGYKEIDKAKILDRAETAFGREVVWSPPAFAGKCVFARNQKEMVC